MKPNQFSDNWHWLILYQMRYVSSLGDACSRLALLLCLSQRVGKDTHLIKNAPAFVSDSGLQI